MGRESGDIELELTQQELEELENLKVTTGLSDSDTVQDCRGDDGGPKKTKKTWQGPPVPKNRDAMGGYVVHPGDKPLSQLQACPNPGPNMYTPSTSATHRRAPGYSLGERHFKKGKRVTPGPNKYNVSGDLAWRRCKRITIKTSARPPIDIKIGPGPGNIPSLGQGPKFSMGSKQKAGRVPGFVSSLASQPDASIPGPDYKPPDTDWVRRPVSFGAKHKTKDYSATKKIGPNKYSIAGSPKGPKWQFGLRLDGDKGKVDEPGPGPGHYDVKDPRNVGKDGAPRPVMVGHKNPNWLCRSSAAYEPGPDVYDRAGFDLSEPGYTIKYRWFDPEIVEKRPDPTTYRVSANAGKKRAPAYSLSNVTTPTYPSSVYAGITVSAPSPTSYTLPNKKTVGKSFGTKSGGGHDKAPGPADYVNNQPRSLPRAPAFSLTGRPRQKRSNRKDPGPAAYKPDVHRATGIRMEPHGCERPYQCSSAGCRKSFSTEGELKRHRRTHNDHGLPGPTSYTPCTIGICNQCDSTGVTLKSRHTPLKYTALRDNANLPPAPSNFPALPLLG